MADEPLITIRAWFNRNGREKSSFFPVGLLDTWLPSREECAMCGLEWTGEPQFYPSASADRCDAPSVEVFLELLKATELLGKRGTLSWELRDEQNQPLPNDCFLLENSPPSSPAENTMGTTEGWERALRQKHALLLTLPRPWKSYWICVLFGEDRKFLAKIEVRSYNHFDSFIVPAGKSFPLVFPGAMLVEVFNCQAMIDGHAKIVQQLQEVDNLISRNK